MAARMAFSAWTNGRKGYIAWKKPGSISLGNEPPEPATWMTMSTTAIALPTSPKLAVSAKMMLTNARLATRPASTISTGCVHWMPRKKRSPPTMRRDCMRPISTKKTILPR